MARPMVALARWPGPNAPASQLMPISFRTGPFTNSAGPAYPVVACTP